jgi:hypothetical protein
MQKIIRKLDKATAQGHTRGSHTELGVLLRSLRASFQACLVSF